MADIHVLTTRNGIASVVWHFPVADANNDVGVNYRDALVTSGMGGSTSMTEGVGPGQITAEEKALVESGAVLEVTKTLKKGMLASGGSTPAEMESTLRVFYARDKALHTDIVAQSLQYYGYTTDEV